MVTSGQMRLRGQTMPRMACAFASPDEPAQTFVAGEQGLDVLVLQFPASALEVTID